MVSIFGWETWAKTNFWLRFHNQSKRYYNMSLDFTFNKFEELCGAISCSEYEKLNIREYLLRKEKPHKCLLLRHDIDAKIERVLRMAEIENRHGISSTYYFRITDEVFKPDIIKKVKELGHEIGYHYEVMDKAKGDPVKAINIFKQELGNLRNISQIDTICMHGNSRTPWNNRELWKSYDFKDFGIIGEGYLTIDFKDILYLSDTGRNWGNRFKVKDNIENMDYIEILSKLKSTDDIIEIINQNKINKIYLLSHPRWVDSLYEWSSEFIFTNIKNLAKIGVKAYDRYKRV